MRALITRCSVNFGSASLSTEPPSWCWSPSCRSAESRAGGTAGGKQRTDATHVLACVRSLSSLESVGETLRASLNAIAEVEPQWLRAQMDEEWFDRYVHRFELARLPKAESKREELRQHVGRDGLRLLKVSQQPQAPQAGRELLQIQLLQRGWQQRDEEVDGQMRWRDGPAVANAQRVVSPY